MFQLGYEICEPHFLLYGYDSESLALCKENFQVWLRLTFENTMFTIGGVNIWNPPRIM
jgi:hypothetical protein